MPEETNRVITDQIADILFCPTQTAVNNLKLEGIIKGVYLVGDVMYDGLLFNLEMAERDSSILRQLDISPKRYLLATVHRVGNVDNLENLENILDAFSRCGETIIFPVHPRTRKQIEASGFELGENIHLHDPMSHIDILKLQKNARLLLTDSGGMQKEIYCLRTPCITLMDQTEWVETVEAGWNVLSGANTERILELIKTFGPANKHPNLYGDGKAAEKIVDILAEASL
jgi:UDP-N-acetylglucosamine 2-epimerase (non-hydrolysing)